MDVDVRNRILVAPASAGVCQCLEPPIIAENALRTTLQHEYKLRDEPAGSEFRVNVLFDGRVQDGLPKLAEAWELNAKGASVIVALCQLSQRLQDPTITLGDGNEVVVTPPAWRQIIGGGAASEEKIRDYMATKSRAEHQFGSVGQTIVAFDLVDLVLLGLTDHSPIQRVAEAHPQYWEQTPSSDFWYRVSETLLQDWEHGELSTETAVAVYQPTSFLEADRYEGARTHYRKAVKYLEDDPANAVKEAMLAVGSIGKQITGKEDADFGPVMDALVSRGLMDGLLGETLKKLQGYASQKEGVRHSSAGPPTRDKAEAAFIVNTAASALMMLREVDPGR